MSYYQAKKCFKENVNVYIDSDKDPVMANLNTGLFQLAEALEQDLSQLEGTLSEIATLLQRQKQR